MEIKVNLEKKYMWTLLIAIFSVGFVLAYGTNNPQAFGHTASEIDGLDQKVSQIIDTKLQSAKYVSQCRIVTAQSSNHEAYAFCANDEFVTGGGCTPSGFTGIRVSRPAGRALDPPAFSWYCEFVDQGDASAVCCK